MVGQPGLSEEEDAPDEHARYRQTCAVLWSCHGRPAERGCVRCNDAEAVVDGTWPAFGGLRLSAERLDARNRGIGGSDANIILSGDDERLLRLWSEKRGEAEPEDLSGRLSVCSAAGPRTSTGTVREATAAISSSMLARRCPATCTPGASARSTVMWRQRRDLRGQAHNSFVKGRSCSPDTCRSCSTMAVAGADAPCCR